MFKGSFFFAVIVCLLLIGLQCYGYFAPTGLNWGFHFLGFLPGYGIWLFLIAAAGIFVLIHLAKERFFRTLQNLAGFMANRPLTFMIGVCTLFIGSALLFRIQAPLLGDSFILINNYEFTYNGFHKLYLHRSPLSFGYFYLFTYLLNTPAYPSIMEAFLTGDIILGIGFIINVFFITKYIFEDSVERLLAFGLLLALPYMQLFFGYVELYSMVLFCLSLFILASILYVQKKLPYYVLPPAYLFLYSANYLNIIVLPALLYLTYLEIRRGKRWTIPLGIFLSAGMIFIVFALMNFETKRFFMTAEHSHWLSLTEHSGDEFQAYTLLSFFHASDLFNWLIFLCAIAVTLLIGAFLAIRKFPVFDEINIFLLGTFTLFLGFIAVVKLDLGFPKDWDVTSPFIFPMYLFALRYFIQTGIPEKKTILSLFFGTALLHSVPWFSVNASEHSTLNRMRTVIDKRITSPSGIYQSMFHLSMYYHHHRMIADQIGIWEHYVSSNPNDLRGYENLTKSYYEGGEQYDSKTIRIFEQWIQVDSSSKNASNKYASFLSESGLTKYRRKEITKAQMFFEKAISLEPQLMAAYTNLATIYIDKNIPDSAIAICNRALTVNPSYIMAYQNMANAYARKQDFDSALSMYKQVLRLDPTNIGAYENMSKAYYQKGDRQQAVETLRAAARLGSKTAQQLLRMSGEAW